MRNICLVLALTCLLTGCRQSLAPSPILPAPTTPPLVIPRPQHLVLRGAHVRIDNRTRLTLATHADHADGLAAQSLQQQLSERFGLNIPIVDAKSISPVGTRIVFGEDAHAGHGRAEGYTIRRGTNTVDVIGQDAAGTFYGAQTLCQLLERDGRGVFVPPVQVQDWPALPWRGVLLFVDNKSLPFHKQIIRRVLARYKMNNLVLECEAARWDALGPNVAPWAATKAQLRAEVQYANRYHITVTPLIESVGHMGWLLKDRPELREDPAVPFAARVGSPETYRMLDAIYDEAIQTFHARALLIGGDEVTQHGRYPDISKAQFPTVAAAYVACVTRLHDHLKARGVRTLLWGDMLLGPGEGRGDTNAPSVADARRMRALLPHDIGIVDWRYHPDDDFRSPFLFTQAGFGPIIGATWNASRDIAGFAQALSASHQRGLLQTTWERCTTMRRRAPSACPTSGRSFLPPTVPGAARRTRPIGCLTTRRPFFGTLTDC